MKIFFKYNIHNITILTCIASVVSCAQLQPTNDKIKNFPEMYVNELCPRHIFAMTEIIRENCLAELTATVGTPALIKQHQDNLERRAQEEAKTNAEVTRRAKTEFETRQRASAAKAAEIAELSSRTGLPYGGEISKSLWGNGFRNLKGSFFYLDVPFKIIACSKAYCLINLPTTDITFSIVRKEDDFTGSFIISQYIAPIGTDDSGNLLVKRLN